jgi:stromal membrane-associated protein
MDNDNRVRALLKQGSNLDCADCGMSGKTAIKFCSVKLGVFLCNQCYAAHRALGAHLTRGKCIGLDEFTDAEVDLLSRLGNRYVNAQYEARLPPGVKPPPTPCRGCSSSSCNDCHERLQYIQKKYEKKLWYSEKIHFEVPVTRTRIAQEADPFGLFQSTTAPTQNHCKDDFFSSFGL